MKVSFNLKSSISGSEVEGLWRGPGRAYMLQLQDETGLDSSRDAEVVMSVLLLLQNCVIGE